MDASFQQQDACGVARAEKISQSFNKLYLFCSLSVLI